ncbi:MAG: HupE/UreJ family protein [Paracoccaceae bacterium]
MKRILSLTALAALAATPAAAHLPPGEYGSFAAGLTHPLFGLDHVLVMIAVGLWAAQIGGRAVWIVPTGFVAAMLAGFLLALAGLPLPAVEPMIVASVLILGTLVALALRPPLWTAVAAVAALGLFHGHAHGGELGLARALTFGAGFVLATALLHATGVIVALGARRNAQERGGLAVRALGGLTALAGLVLAAG